MKVHCVFHDLKTAYTEKEMSHAFVKGTTLLMKFHYDNTKMFSIPCFLNKCLTSKNVYTFHTASQPSAVCMDSETNLATLLK